MILEQFTIIVMKFSGHPVQKYCSLGRWWLGHVRRFWFCQIIESSHVHVCCNYANRMKTLI